MKLTEGKVFIVTKESDDGTFLVGDHISLLEDGSICCKEAGGWIVPEEVEDAIKGMEFEEDIEWKTKAKLQLEKLLKNIQ